MALLANRMTMCTSTSKHIAKVEENWGGAELDQAAEDEEEYIDALGKGDGRCRRCGGAGHFARTLAEGGATGDADVSGDSK